MSAGDFSVNVVNPGGTRRRRRKGSKSSSSRKNPSSRRHRRRRNPIDWRGQGELFRVDWAQLAWMLAGDAWISWFTRTWGDPWGTSMLSNQQIAASDYQGQAWTLKNYLFALATGFGVSRMMEHMGGRGGEGGKAIWKMRARHFFLGVKFGVIRRILWTEAIGRWDWAKKYLGDVNDVYNTGTGAVWMATPGGYQQAMDGPTRDARPWQMLGPVRDARPWQMLGQGGMPYGPQSMMYEAQEPEMDPGFMGHALVSAGQSADLANYQYSGSESPYAASYNR